MKNLFTIPSGGCFAVAGRDIDTIEAANKLVRLAWRICFCTGVEQDSEMPFEARQKILPGGTMVFYVYGPEGMSSEGERALRMFIQGYVWGLRHE